MDVCSFGSQAGLLSAVTSAFIIQVNSQLQPDPGNETTALLRVLIHKIDNTTFAEDNVPVIPRWNGPSKTTVLAQAFLLTSLAASLFSAFLAMLSKQWLNLYGSVDMRETVIERGRNRQRRLDGIVTWNFTHLMESLPLALQIGLYFLGAAIFLSLADINATASLIALGLTSFKALLHISVVVAGATFEGCPYQTFASHFLRSLRPIIPITRSLRTRRQPQQMNALEQKRIVLEQQTIALNLRCVSWILWTSLEKGVICRP
jgi:hypothetical protein